MDSNINERGILQHMADCLIGENTTVIYGY